MTDLTKAVALSGALDEGQLQELNKWRLPIEIPSDEPFESPEDAVAAIESALEGENQVEVRTTDLDVLKQYLRTQRKGKLHLATEAESGTWDVTFGITTLGQYIVPWRTDSISEILMNGESHLLDGRRKVYISDVQDLYFGETKVFIVCTPRDRHAKRPVRNKS